MVNENENFSQETKYPKYTINTAKVTTITHYLSVEFKF